MGVQTVTMLSKAWYGDEEMKLEFPDSWEVIEKRMPGHDAPALDDDQMRAALGKPIGAAKLTDLAKGKKKVVILFDDLTRPTPTWRILPFVFELLKEAGIEDKQIVFVAAIANHLPMMRDDFAKKLGADIPSRFQVFNHNPYEHCVEIGKTSRGTPVQLNREVAGCDLKIGIGAVIPHTAAGFGGGAKIVLPGVCSIDTVRHNHIDVGRTGPGQQRNPTLGLGKVEGNEMREDMEETAKIAGLDWKIDVLLNARREITGLFCGDVVAEHRAAVAIGRKMYSTPAEPGCDITVANTYPIDIQVSKGIWPAVACIKDGGSAVVIANSVQGEATHFLSGKWGSDYGGATWSQGRLRQLSHARRIYYMSEYPTAIMREALGGSDTVSTCTHWTEVLVDLMLHYGKNAKVAVYPYASLQCPPI